MRIVGLCRFSFLSRFGGAWKAVPLMPGKARALLFDRDRLETRFGLFERYTLPGIRAQTDADFRFVILTSAELPRPWLDRLTDAAAGDPRISVRAFPVRRTGPLLREVFAEEFAGESGDDGQRVSFRLDDDDGLSVDFVRRLRAEAGARDPRRPFFVSFGNGLAVSHANGRVAWASESAHAFSVGLALSAPPGHPQCVYDYNHRECFRYHDTAVLAGAPGFIRCLHDFNDSGAKRVGARNRDRTTLAALARKFRAEFPYLAAGG